MQPLLPFTKVTRPYLHMQLGRYRYICSLRKVVRL